MVDITLFELHLKDSSLTASSPFRRGEKQVTASDEAPEVQSSSKGKLVGALVGVVFLAAVAFVVRKKVGGGDSVDDERVELADVKA